MRLLVLFVVGNEVLSFRHHPHNNTTGTESIYVTGHGTLSPEIYQEDASETNLSLDTSTSTNSSFRNISHRVIPTTWIHPQLRGEPDNAHDQVAHGSDKEEKKPFPFPKEGTGEKDTLSSFAMFDLVSDLDNTDNQFWLAIADGIGQNMRHDKRFHEHLKRNNISHSALLQHTADENAGHHHLLHRVVRNAVATEVGPDDDKSDDYDVRKYCVNPANIDNNTLVSRMKTGFKDFLEGLKESLPNSPQFNKCWRHTASMKSEFRYQMLHLLARLKKFATEEYNFITSMLRWDVTWTVYPPKVTDALAGWAALFPSLGFKCQPLTQCLKGLWNGIGLLKDVIMQIASGLMKMLLAVGKYVSEAMQCMAGYLFDPSKAPEEVSPPPVRFGLNAFHFEAKQGFMGATSNKFTTELDVIKTKPSTESESLSIDSLENTDKAQSIWWHVVDLGEGYVGLWHYETKKWLTTDTFWGAKLKKNKTGEADKKGLFDDPVKESFKFVTCGNRTEGGPVKVAIWSKDGGYVNIGTKHRSRLKKGDEAEKTPPCFTVVDGDSADPMQVQISKDPKEPNTGEVLFNTEKLAQDPCWKNLRLKGGINLRPDAWFGDGFVSFAFGTCPQEFNKWGPNMLACARTTIKKIKNMFHARDHVGYITESYFAKDNCNDHALGMCQFVTKMVKCKYDLEVTGNKAAQETQKKKGQVLKRKGAIHEKEKDLTQIITPLRHIMDNKQMKRAYRFCQKLQGMYAMLTKIDGQVRCAKPVYDNIDWTGKGQKYFDKARDSKVSIVDMKQGCLLVVKHMKKLLDPKKCLSPKDAKEAHAQCRRLFKCPELQDQNQRLVSNWEDYFLTGMNAWAREQVNVGQRDHDLVSVEGIRDVSKMIDTVAEVGKAFTDSVQEDHLHANDYHADAAANYADTIWVSDQWQDDCFILNTKNAGDKGHFVTDKGDNKWKTWAVAKINKDKGIWKSAEKPNDIFQSLYDKMTKKIPTEINPTPANFWYKFKRYAQVDDDSTCHIHQGEWDEERLEKGHDTLRKRVLRVRQKKLPHQKIRILAEMPFQASNQQIILKSSGWDGIPMEVTLELKQSGSWVLQECKPKFKCRGVAQGDVKAELEQFKISMVPLYQEEYRDETQEYIEAIASGTAAYANIKNLGKKDEKDLQDALSKASTSSIVEWIKAIERRKEALKELNGQLVAKQRNVRGDNSADVQQFQAHIKEEEKKLSSEVQRARDLAWQKIIDATEGGNDDKMLELAALECYRNFGIVHENEGIEEKAAKEKTKAEREKLLKDVKEISWVVIPELVSKRALSDLPAPMDAATQGDWMPPMVLNSNDMEKQDFQKHAPNKLDILLAQNHFNLISPQLDMKKGYELLYNGRTPHSAQLKELAMALFKPHQGLYLSMAMSAEEVLRNILRGRKVLTNTGWQEYLHTGQTAADSSPVQYWTAEAEFKKSDTADSLLGFQFKPESGLTAWPLTEKATLDTVMDFHSKAGYATPEDAANKTTISTKFKRSSTGSFANLVTKADALIREDQVIDTLQVEHGGTIKEDDFILVNSDEYLVTGVAGTDEIKISPPLLNDVVKESAVSVYEVRCHATFGTLASHDQPVERTQLNPQGYKEHELLVEGDGEQDPENAAKQKAENVEKQKDQECCVRCRKEKSCIFWLVEGNICKLMRNPQGRQEDLPKGQNEGYPRQRGAYKDLFHSPHYYEKFKRIQATEGSTVADVFKRIQGWKKIPDPEKTKGLDELENVIMERYQVVKAVQGAALPQQFDGIGIEENNWVARKTGQTMDTWTFGLQSVIDEEGEKLLIKQTARKNGPILPHFMQGMAQKVQAQLGGQKNYAHVTLKFFPRTLEEETAEKDIKEPVMKPPDLIEKGKLASPE